MNSCCVAPARTAAGPPCPGTTSRGRSAAAPSRSCCTPCLSCIHFSIAMPMASGTDSTLLGPSPTGLAERDEDLERLPLVVLRDGDVHRAERRLDPARRALQQVGTRALGAPL